MDILEALEAAGIEIHSGSNEDEINICCPFCLEEGETSLDERFRLGINIRNGKFQCFNCQKRGGGGDWIFKELQRVLDTGEIEANQSKKKRKISGKVELPEGFCYITAPEVCFSHWAIKAYKYLRKRGISERQLEEKEKGIGYTVIGEYHHRIIFPAYIRGKLKGFAGREFIGDLEPKYKNSVGDKTLYNYPDRNNKEAVLSESAIPALVIERAAKKLHIDSLGLLGHSLTDSQLALLEPYKRIILWLDPDPAGVKGALSIVKKIPKDKIVKIVLPRDFVHSGATDADPDELELEVITKRLLKAEVFNEGLQQKLKAWSAWDE